MIMSIIIRGAVLDDGFLGLDIAGCTYGMAWERVNDGLTINSNI
jgi:hypothetical protein